MLSRFGGFRFQRPRRLSGAGGLTASEEATFACVDVASPRLVVARLAID
jgi:hypothetical protein